MDKPPPEPKPVTPEWLFRAAAHYLERYASTTENLRRVLERKVRRRAHARGEDAAAHSDLVNATVARFVDLKLLDDRSFAESRLATLRRRGASQRMMAAKLVEKGVARDLVHTLLAHDATSEREAAAAYAKRRRLGPHRPRDRAERRERDIAAMMRAGFGFSDALAIIDGDGGDEQ